MTQRYFTIALVILAVVVALCATTFPGSLIGYMFAMASLLYSVAIAAVLCVALQRVGIPVTPEQLLWGLGGVGAVLVLLAAVQIVKRMRHGDPNGARLAGLRLAILLALPLMAWLSLNAMQRNWP